ncbi:hypothetical protein B0H11DRAFT_1061411 [Mycena galericulata]|nr:hypothetical protein B0H11DRAFT_1061411 [Mycena galericulata]
MDRANDGFPSLYFRTEICGYSWDASVYAGLRQFQGKGFDPDSQDIALHLGQPLYQLSRGRDAPFAHIDNEYSCDENESSAITVQTALEVTERYSGENDEISARDTIPAKRAAEDSYENTKEQTVKDATQDNLALRHLMLNEKEQLIEMHKLGIYTKEEFISQVAKIEARYEAGTA